VCAPAARLRSRVASPGREHSGSEASEESGEGEGSGEGAPSESKVLRWANTKTA